MSDPVTNVEIEDVLSSIRKLVADDARSSPAATPKPKADRLVLTPAFRVTDTTDAPDDTSHSTPEPMVLTDPVPQEAPKAVQERPLDDIPGDARLADFGDVEGAFPDVDMFEDAEPTSDTDMGPVGPAQSNARLDLGRLIEAEVAAALGGSADDDESQVASEDPWVSDDPDPDDTAEADIAFEHRPLDQHAAPEANTDTESAVDVPPPPHTLEDKVAALSRLVNGGSQDFEEERDTPDADDLTAVAEPMVWPNDTTYEAQTGEGPGTVATEDDEPETKDEPHDDEESIVVRASAAWPVEAQTAEASVDDEATDEDAYAASAGEVMLTAPTPNAPQSPAIDEDMLRELVSDIVRQELQGVLGERITRNVRKLVRREIHRMLVSQELE